MAFLQRFFSYHGNDYIMITASRPEQGVEPDDLLCSRNARLQKVGKGSLVVLLLAERAR
jgi:hypothetical protein